MIDLQPVQKDGECRHAEYACGIDVYATARKRGFPLEVVQTVEDVQHYYGLVLVE